jgi:hypothetical protein
MLVGRKIVHLLIIWGKTKTIQNACIMILAAIVTISSK